MCIDQEMYFEQLQEQAEAEEQWQAYQFQKEFDEWLDTLSKQRKRKRDVLDL